MSNQIYIIDAVRTPMGRTNGKLKGFSVDALFRFVIEALLERNRSSKNLVDEVIMGNAVSSGIGQNAVRKALIDAGLSETIHGYAVNSVCASGLQALINGCQSIIAGDTDLVICGGAESASNMPELIFKKNHDIKKIRGLTQSLMHDGLWCSVSDRWMGLLCEDMARKEKISKKEQDDYAFESYQRILEAKKQGFFSDEIIEINFGANKMLNEDETVRTNINREIFDSFESAFEYKGTVTAGNSAAPCDGACGLILASDQTVKDNNLHPLAAVRSYVSVAASACDVFLLAGRAIRSALTKAGISLEQVDLFEISEAFAAQMVFTQKDLKGLGKKINVYGGDIALGHPLGAAGARSLVTLAHALKRRQQRYGVACACFGGGGAAAVVLENKPV